MDESDGDCEKLMEIVEFTRVGEVPLTLVIVGALGGGGRNMFSGNNKTFDIFVPSSFNIKTNEVDCVVFPVPN